MDSPAVSIKGLKKRNGAFVLDIDRFSVTFGTIVGLVGENGAGKTTFLNIMAKRSLPDEGTLLFADELREDGNASVSCVFDRPDVDEILCAFDIDLIFRNLYARWSSEEFFSYIDAFGIERKKKISDMSRGMKTKTMLAIALSHGAKLLLLDEVTSGIDPYSKSDMLRMIRSYVSERNAAAILSSHIVSDLEQVGDFCAVLSSGSIKSMGSMEDIKKASGPMSVEEYIVSLRGGEGSYVDAGPDSE